MAKVAICIPHASKILPDFERTVDIFIQANPLHQYTRTEVELMIIGKARNMIVETAEPYKPDVYLFIDDDVLIPHTAGVLIDQAMSLGVVSGVYYSKKYPYTPEVFKRATEPEFAGRTVYWPYVEMPMTGIFKADAVGAGCLAISASIFDHLYSFYTRQVREQAQLLTVDWIKQIVENLSPWFEFLDKKGEDMYFCERATGLGYNIWVNADIQCTHVGETPITKEHFLQVRNSVPFRKEIKQ